MVYDPCPLTHTEAATKFFMEKAVLKNFAVFTGKHLCWSLFFNKVASLKTFIKKRFRHRCFHVNIPKLHLFWRTSANSCFCTYDHALSNVESVRSSINQNFIKYINHPYKVVHCFYFSRIFTHSTLNVN